MNRRSESKCSQIYQSFPSWLVVLGSCLRNLCITQSCYLLEFLLFAVHRALFNLELIFFFCIVWGRGQISLFHMDFLLTQYHCSGELFCHKSGVHICMGLLLDSNMFHWSIGLSLCEYHIVLIAVALNLPVLYQEYFGYSWPFTFPHAWITPGKNLGIYTEIVLNL